MTPAKYLTYGTLMVLAIIALIVGQNWRAADSSLKLHDQYLHNALIQEAMGDLRSAANRIVSSSNEAALFTVGKAVGLSESKEVAGAAGETAEAKEAAEAGKTGEAGEEGDPEQQLAREFALIAEAKTKSQKAITILNAQADSGDSGLDVLDVVEVCRKFDELVKVTDAFVATISSRAPTESVMEAKEAQEDAEIEVLERIAQADAKLRAVIDAKAGDLQNDFAQVKSTNLIAAGVVGVLLLALGYFLRGRINEMFLQIRAQNGKIAEANAGLEKALSELKCLQQTLVEKERLSMLGRLTATVSHELRNPLGSLRNSLFTLRRKAKGSQDMLTLIERADRSIGRCDHIIADLLEFTRDHALNRKSTDLVKIIRAAAADVGLPHGVTLAFSFPDEPLIHSLDVERFPRVLINLIENAVHAQAQTRRPGVVTVSCENRGEVIDIVVADTGCGIPRDAEAKIFEPLYTTKSFGAGLGLPIARTLVVQHGGTIRCDSTPGKGARFTITLPVTAEAAAPLAA